MKIERFIEARLREQSLSDPVDLAYRRILSLADGIKRDGETDDWLSWIDSEVEVKVGEYLLGIDSATAGEQTRARLLAVLAATWSEHPDFEQRWGKLAGPAPKRS